MLKRSNAYFFASDNVLALSGRFLRGLFLTAKDLVFYDNGFIDGLNVDELTKNLENNIQQRFSGKINRTESTTFKISKNLDFKKTIRKNLKNYDNTLQTLIPHTIYFNPRIKRYNPWNIVLCVDQSGSMLESVIYSAIMASIFAKLPILRISLIIFDTEVVNLTGYVDDPVDVLMSVQLGGGTDIGKAMEYCETLIETPVRTLMFW